ncbi:MAG: sigma-70 family RNA polymerase sigma factor [Candidatus Omnitrophota bacterium]
MEKDGKKKNALNLSLHRPNWLVITKTYIRWTLAVLFAIESLFVSAEVCGLSVPVASQSLKTKIRMQITYELARILDESVDDEKRKEIMFYFTDVVQSGFEKVNDSVGFLAAYLDFTDDSLEQMFVNAAVLRMLEKMPVKYKTLKLILKTVKFIEYKGEQSHVLKKAGLSFFKSFPDEIVFNSADENKNGIKLGLDWGSEMNGYYAEISQYPLLSHIGEIRLGVIMRVGTESEQYMAREQLMVSNLRLCIFAAKKFFNWTGMDILNLAMEGNLGLIDTVDRYDPCRGTRFATYALWWIRLRIGNYVIGQRKDIRLPVNIHQKVSVFKKKCELAGIDLKNKENSDESIAFIIKMPVAKVGELREIMNYEESSFSLPQRDKSGEEMNRSKLESLTAVNGDFRKREDSIMFERIENELRKGLFKRTENAIRKNEKAGTAIKVIDILWQRIVPRVLRKKDCSEKLENVGKKHDDTKEYMRQLERKVKLYLKRQAISPEEKTIVKDFFERENAPKSSLAELLRIIYDKFGFNYFKPKDIARINERYNLKVSRYGFAGLKKVAIIKKNKKEQYKINPIFKERTEFETEKNIESLCNLQYRIGRKKAALARLVLPKGKDMAVRECIKMDQAHFSICRISRDIEKKRCILNVWKGYAGDAQKQIAQYMRKLSEEGPYKVNFQEIDELINRAVNRKNELLILPFNRLSESQQRKLQNLNVWFINMDFEKKILSPFDFMQLEAIVAAGIAYLNNDDFVFNKLYKILTGSDFDIGVCIEDLKNYPNLAVKYVFMIETTEIGLDDLKPLNDRMKSLLNAV